jgi:glycosyltransferase involved in cell wall biosynthesis/SAM-dependent methyltransferase
MPNDRIRVHVLFERSADGLPHGSSVIRLLRPLSHPSIEDRLILSQGLSFPDHMVDILIIDRMWDYSSDWQAHSIKLQSFRARGTKIVCEIDDDLLEANFERNGSSRSHNQQKIWLLQLIRFADGVIVSTKKLAERFAHLNSHVEVIENSLDERLFDSNFGKQVKVKDEPLVFGYMGTFTHLDDLMSIIRPLRTVIARYRQRVRFEIVGVGKGSVLEAAFSGLPVKLLTVPPEFVPYEKFTAWMQENVRWDFAIAPLADTPFTSCKSDIKFLDYGVLGIPGIFSEVPAYSQTVAHLVNGILVPSIDAWERCLESMILDDQLRGALATRSHHLVWEQRMLRTSAINWLTILSGFLSNPTKKDANKRFISSLTRNEKVLFECNLQGSGLEIGASYSPVAPKSAGYKVDILDHADAATLKNKYSTQNVNISNIEEVDYVWSGEPLQELTGKTSYYDWIVASHVIEHTPDLIAFLQQCEIMLKPGGRLCLAIPDHRYCFDVFRPANTPGDVIQAFLEKRRRHSPGAVWDHFSMITKKGKTVSWYRGHPGEYELIHPDLRDARTMFERAQETEEYIDVHNWRFTPSSFKLIVNNIRELKYTSLFIESFFDTVGSEFIVHLEKGILPTAKKTQRGLLMKEMLLESKDLAAC